jgi:hypothetical protein
MKNLPILIFAVLKVKLSRDGTCPGERGDRLVWELRPDGNQLVVVSPRRNGQGSDGEAARKHKRH